MSSALTKRPSHELSNDGQDQQLPLYQPEVDIVETAAELVVYADMPGIDRETLDVSFDDRTLTMRARMASGLHPKGGTSVWSEYGVGDYSRSFYVGELVNAAEISAQYADGVLVVRLPKVEATQARKITVTAGE